MKKMSLKEAKKVFLKRTDISDITKALKQLRVSCDLSQENIIIIGIDIANKLIFSKVLFKGGMSECSIDPNFIYKQLLLNNCKRFILGHNHPSGNLSPSDADISVQKIIIKQTKILNFELLDNIIFNKDNYISLMEK